MLQGFFLRIAAALTAIYAVATSAQAQSFLAGEFDPTIPTGTQVLGHAPGTRMSTPNETLTYLRALAAAAPDRMKIVQYGEIMSSLLRRGIWRG